MYGAKTWTIRMADEHALQLFEREVVKKIYGPVCVNNTCEWSVEKRTNNEMYEILEHGDIVRSRVQKTQEWAMYSGWMTGGCQRG